MATTCSPKNFFSFIFKSYYFKFFVEGGCIENIVAVFKSSWKFKDV